MTTISLPTPTYQRRNRAPLVLLALFVIAFASLSLHALSRHGEAAVTINQQCNNGGTLETWINETTGRRANICLMPDGKFGIEICEGDTALTCIPKEKMSRIEQIWAYLRNRGYAKP